MDKRDKAVIRAAMRWNKAYLRYMQMILNCLQNEAEIRVTTFQKAQRALSVACLARHANSVRERGKK